MLTDQHPARTVVFQLNNNIAEYNPGTNRLPIVNIILHAHHAEFQILGGGSFTVDYDDLVDGLSVSVVNGGVIMRYELTQLELDYDLRYLRVENMVIPLAFHPITLPLIDALRRSLDAEPDDGVTAIPETETKSISTHPSTDPDSTDSDDGVVRFTLPLMIRTVGGLTKAIHGYALKAKDQIQIISPDHTLNITTSPQNWFLYLIDNRPVQDTVREEHAELLKLINAAGPWDHEIELSKDLALISKYGSEEAVITKCYRVPATPEYRMDRYLLLGSRQGNSIATLLSEVEITQCFRDWHLAKPMGDAEGDLEVYSRLFGRAPLPKEQQLPVETVSQFSAAVQVTINGEAYKIKSFSTYPEVIIAHCLPGLIPQYFRVKDISTMSMDWASDNTIHTNANSLATLNTVIEHITGVKKHV